MRTKILLIRHGESMANAMGVFAGSTDVPLSETGRRQAAVTADFLKEVPVDAVYASDLCRAVETAEAVARPRGLSVNIEPGLREINCGQWEGLSHEEIARRFPELLRVWREDLGKAELPGGESVAQVSRRAMEALARIAGRHCGETVCIASHGMVIRCLAVAVSGWGTEGMMRLDFAANASVTTIFWEDGRFSLEEYGHADHMGDLATYFTEKSV